MRTYPAINKENEVLGFEISSSWIWIGFIFKILRSCDEVTEIKRIWFKDDRASFKFNGIACVIHEPWGDSSRYWIGPKNTDTEIDLTKVHKLFQNYSMSFTFDKEFKNR